MRGLRLTKANDSGERAKISASATRTPPNAWPAMGRRGGLPLTPPLAAMPPLLLGLGAGSGVCAEAQAWAPRRVQGSPTVPAP